MKHIERLLPFATALALVSPLAAHEADNFKLTASDQAAGDGFGSAVAIDGTVALVASPMADGVGADSGAVYVFTFDGMLWNETAKLTASDASAGALFGTAVALAGNRLVIGAAGANAGDGAAYAFSFDGVSWSEDSVLAPAGLAAGAGFGSSLDIDGDTAVIGAPNAGSAYVFFNDGVSWAQEGDLVATTSSAGDRFGSGVTVNGDLVAVGAPNGNGVALNSGLVNLFFRSAGVWSQGQVLQAPSGNTGDRYGESVDMFGGVELLIGIPGFDIGGAESGGGQRWSRASGIWRDVQSYPGRDTGDEMGTVVSLNGRTSVLGVAGDDDEALDAGTAYRFLKNSVTPLEIYVGHDAEVGAAFGAAVSVSDTWAVNGSPLHGGGTGAAYIHSTVQAIVTPLLGSGINPNIMSTTAGPVIGQPWTVDIDLTLFPDSELTAIVLKKNPMIPPLVIPLGEVFFSLSDPVLIRNTGLGNHVINVPDNPALLDNEGTIMGIVYGKAIDSFPILALTNGETIVIGTTDFPVNEEE